MGGNVDNKNVRKRLLLVGNTLQTFGGGEKWLLELALLLKNTYKITILNPISKKSIVKVKKLDIYKVYKLHKEQIIDLPSIGIDSVAHGTEHFLLVLPSLRSIAVINKSIEECNTVYCLSSNPVLLCVITFFAWAHKKKLILGVHNPSFHKLFEANSSVQQYIMNSIYKFVLNCVPYFHVINSDDERLIRMSFAKARVFRIPNFIIRAQRPCINRRRFIVIFIARFQKYQKGIDLLPNIISKTLKHCKDIEFHLIGSGGDGEEIVRLLITRYSSNVKYLGFLSDKLLDKEYANASALIFPSRFEGFPLTLLEAQNFGLPVVAFGVQGVKDIIKLDIQGSLIKPFDTSMFADELVKLFNAWRRDRYNYLKLKIRISRHVNDIYSSKHIIPDIIKMLG